MKKIILLLISAACTLATYAQTHTETFNACNKPYTVVCEQLEGNKIKLSFTDGSDGSKKKLDSLTTTDMDQFAKSFKFFFLNFVGAPDSTSCTQDEKDNFLLAYGRKLYLNFRTALTQDSATPVAGLFKIKDSILIHGTMRYLADSSLHKLNFPFKKYKIEKVQAEINNGFIENIKAYIQMPDGTHYFSIPYPIGISSVANFKRYSSRALFDTDSPIYFRRVGRHEIADRLAQDTSRFKLVRVDSTFYLYLSDLITYDYYYGVDRRDYSPKNDIIDLNGGESKILHKEETSKLFEAHIFTDFIGLNENKPNGLVQAEVSKRINANSSQHLAPKWIYWLFKSFGGFQYISPSVSVSKLEQHNKRLILGDLDSIRLHPGPNDTSRFNRGLHRYLSPLDLYQYQSFSAGLDVNIGYLSNHDLKYNLYFNMGARLGMTPVQDSVSKIDQGTITRTGLVNEYTVNTFQFYPQVIVTFLPEERFNLAVSEQLFYIKPLNQQVQLMYLDKNDNTLAILKKGAWLNILEMLMTIQVNPNSKLFGRVRLNTAWDNASNNFAQVQVGYSTYILGNK